MQDMQRENPSELMSLMELIWLEDDENRRLKRFGRRMEVWMEAFNRLSSPDSVPKPTAVARELGWMTDGKMGIYARACAAAQWWLVAGLFQADDLLEITATEARPIFEGMNKEMELLWYKEPNKHHARKIAAKAKKEIKARNPSL